MNCESLTSDWANNDISRWFAIYTAPRHEKCVAEMITARNIEIFLPLYRTTRQWKKRPPVTLELPLFPSYLFVRVSSRERGPVLSTPGVLAFVGSGRHAMPVPDCDIDALQSGIKDHRAEPHTCFAVGESVRVKSGSFAGFTGTLVRNRAGERVVLTIDAIMQGIAVEIDASNLESVVPGSNSATPAHLSLVM